MAKNPAPGALVLSLDFELLWGLRDGFTEGYAGNLHGVRRAVPGMLRLFEEFGVAATWATVGFLLAGGREEAEAFSPTLRPRYADARLDPYVQPMGDDEAADPLHFAPSLVEMIRRTPRQEMATHTFSHYYCLEAGQDRAAFDADLRSAVRIAAHHGFELRSIVFPRNQHNPAYDDVLRAHGIRCFRGVSPGWMNRAERGTGPGNSRVARAARLIDSHVGLSSRNTLPWSSLRPHEGLSNVASTFILRPVTAGGGVLQRLRAARIEATLERAARKGEVVHLWWHPHNFGVRTDENLQMLRGLLERFDHLRSRMGMLSLGMHEAAVMAAEVGA